MWKKCLLVHSVNRDLQIGVRVRDLVRVRLFKSCSHALDNNGYILHGRTHEHMNSWVFMVFSTWCSTMKYVANNVSDQSCSLSLLLCWLAKGGSEGLDSSGNVTGLKCKSRTRTQCRTRTHDLKVAI